MNFAKSRRPRFRRDAAIRRISLTGRDMDILRRVADLRFMRTSDIAALAGGSRQNVLRRLQLLYHHGYLDRPLSQLDHYRPGAREMAYGLGSRGAALLRSDPAFPFLRPSKAGRPFLEHALMVSAILARIELDCRRHPSARFLSRRDIAPTDAAASSSRPLRWHVDLSTRHRIGVVPDAVFGLEYIKGSDVRERAWFFLEADRSTMPCVRSGLRMSSYFRKLLSYEATWRQRIHLTKLGLHRFRVLTVTTSRSRLVNLLSSCRDLERGRGLFLFTDLPSLAASGDALAHLWDSPVCPGALLALD